MRLEKLNQGFYMLPPLRRLFGERIEDHFPLREYNAVSANHCLNYLLYEDVICVFNMRKKLSGLAVADFFGKGMEKCIHNAPPLM